MESDYCFSGRFEFRFAQQFQECLRGGVEAFLLAVNDAQRTVELGRRQWNRGQPSLRHFIAHDARGQDADAGAVRYCLLDHLQIVEVQGVGDFDLMLAQETVHFAADRQIFVEANEVDAIEIFGGDPSSLRQRMIRGRRQHHFLLTPGDHGDLPAGLRIAHQAEIGLIRQHRRIHFFRPQVFDIQMGFGPPPRELVFELRHLAQSHRIDGGDLNGSIQILFQLVQRNFELFFTAQDVAAEIAV